MSRLSPAHASTDPSPGDRPRVPPHGARVLAEWVSFGVSAAVVVALATYLVQDALREKGPVVPIEVTVAMDKSAKAHDRFVVPVTVHNRGRRTLKDVKVEVVEPTSGMSSEMREFEIDYLPEGSHETVYVYIDAHPNLAKLHARAVQYRLE